MKRKSKTSFGEMKPLSFFKLMISRTCFSTLRIPEKFASAFHGELCGACTLKVPTGETKQVELVEDDNKLWFQGGWQEFVDYFSVGYGYFLLFSYQGNSTFGVHIFNLTACEIAYQCNECTNSPKAEEPCHDNSCPGSSGTEVMSSKDDFGSDDADANDSDTVSRAGLQSTSAMPNNSDLEAILLGSEDDEIKAQEGIKSSRNKKKNGGTELRYPSWLWNYEEVIKAVAAAGISIPENPFFVSLIKPSNIYKGNYLTIPRDFAQEHLIRCKKEDLVTLETYDGRQWLVQCGRKSQKLCSLGKRWILFAREIGLEVGDVCVFELSDAENNVLKVKVVKKANLVDSCTSLDSKDDEIKPQQGRKRSRNKEEGKANPLLSECSTWLRKNDGVLKAAAAAAGVCLPENPFFVALIKYHDLQKGCYMYIPVAFAREHLKWKNGDLVTVETYDERRWLVQCYRNHTACTLSRGWTIVAREIGLEVGDVCVFELSDAENYVLKVQVAKKAQIKDANLML